MIKIKKPIFLTQLKTEVTNLGDVSIINGRLIWEGTATEAEVQTEVDKHIPIFPVIPKRDLKAEYAAALNTEQKLNIIAEVLNLL